jgi:uncharacterized membrane protein YhaH (DUF805 family)
MISLALIGISVVCFLSAVALIVKRARDAAKGSGF